MTEASARGQPASLEQQGDGERNDHGPMSQRQYPFSLELNQGKEKQNR